MAICVMIGNQALTAKQEAFCREYLIDLNGAAAARRAGYSASNSNKMAHDCMKHPVIRDRIRVEMAKRAERTEVKADKVLSDLAEIAHLDRSCAFRVIGNELYITDTDLLPPQVRRCIAEVSQTPSGIKIKFDDRVRALELLGKHLALFTDNLNVGGKLETSSTDVLTDEQLARIAAQANTKPEEGKCQT